MKRGDKMEQVMKRFLKYVKYETTSQEESTSCPSSPGQMTLAKDLADELKALGLEDVILDSNGYLMATLPANTTKNIPVIGFIAHLDTSPDISGANVSPQVVENYQGQDIILNQEQNIILSPKDFPVLLNYLGDTLITTDGTTLLGADNKAGIAEIVTAVEYLLSHPEIEHGTIRIAFTPDEEIGRGADFFNVEKFQADFAYTIDGEELGELQYENFNAARGKITIRGKNIHPGHAKNKMKNALLIGAELTRMLPEKETPAQTEGYEGFYHLNSFHGSVEECKLDYIIRDFDLTSFQQRKSLMVNIVQQLNQKYGEGTVILEMKDQYYNMKEKLKGFEHIIETARQAMEEVGVKPLINPIRGGTDGAHLAFMGLPTPNIFTGGHNFHGRHEFIPLSAMKKALAVILKIIELYTQK